MENFFVAVRENVVFPRRATKYSAGIDFFPPEDLELHPGEKKTVKSGIAFRNEFEGYGIIADRSSVFLSGVSVFRGIIDGDYGGEIKFLFQNQGKQVVKISRKKAMAQMTLHRLSDLTLALPPEDKRRGEGGFGSTVSSIKSERVRNTNAVRVADSTTSFSMRLYLVALLLGLWTHLSYIGAQIQESPSIEGWLKGEKRNTVVLF